MLSAIDDYSSSEQEEENPSSSSAETISLLENRTKLADG